jgi:cytochrome c oxidase subunit 4
MASPSVTGRTYLRIWLALLALTGVSFLSSLLPLGAAGLGLALAIATAKAALVALFFMDLVGQPLATRLVLVVAALWVGVLVLLVALDPATRTTFPPAPQPPARAAQPP